VSYHEGFFLYMQIIMRDPVCNEYGNSYSRRAYLVELQKNGRMDPVLNKPIKTNILYPNVNLKKAIEGFLEKNPWAYDEVIQ
jgi:STIP1 family protein 1